ncbi:metal-sensitive transcriptional regulator [Streptomyces sp. SAI-090]|jgi:DNA-binding FrmR family transcriptional regulator|uniref:metal-sensitive transcriptional regulator n=1 Tax=Streptomyces sp. SAI-090 TaxID=2940545 RepID=UPI002475AA53|nr:metal-sensitive transcriptional regulator [Streptomyces sp. SAI-090]MDH6522303.1 DNA-binding FrmR family transcriptional regulator [Streptomyces sp. SAI-090]
MTTTGSGHELRPSAAPDGDAPKQDLLARMHRVEGQVRGVTRMVEQDRYCIDVLTQISAVHRALQEVALGLLDQHARHCMLDAARSDPAAGEAKLDELTTALRRTLRL